MTRNRRSFLKAALGCATALVVPGALPSVTPKPESTVTYCNWYKPGIWAMAKDDPGLVNVKLIPGTLIVMTTDKLVYLRMENGSWKESKGVRSSKPFLER